MTGGRPFDAVVLAGGGSTRMAGRDKTRLTVGDRPLLDRVLDCTAGAREVIVVGERRPTARAVTWTLEEPPGGGPAAAIGAALALVRSTFTVVLAADLPFVTAATITAVLDAVEDDGAILVDDAGRAQWLCSAWRTASLRGLPLVAGESLHATLGGLRTASVAVPAGGAPAWFDCDTPDDVRQARELA